MVKLIVLRDSENSQIDGRWYDFSAMPRRSCGRPKIDGEATYGPTGEYDQREDGETAEVYRRVKESSP